MNLAHVKKIIEAMAVGTIPVWTLPIPLFYGSIDRHRPDERGKDDIEFHESFKDDFAYQGRIKDDFEYQGRIKDDTDHLKVKDDCSPAGDDNECIYRRCFGSRPAECLTIKKKGSALLFGRNAFNTLTSPDSVNLEDREKNFLPSQRAAPLVNPRRKPGRYPTAGEWP